MWIALMWPMWRQRFSQSESDYWPHWGHDSLTYSWWVHDKNLTNSSSVSNLFSL